MRVRNVIGERVARSASAPARSISGWAALIVILSLLVSPVLLAQENTGSIKGVVKDPTGAVTPGATVTAGSPALVRSIETNTDERGGYIFPKLPAGTYTVTVVLPGFSTITKDNVELKLGRELTVDFQLSVGNITETVSVTAAAELLDVTSSKTITSIDEKIIDNTPKGRTFNSLLNYAPGVRFEPKAASVAGVVASSGNTGGVTGTSGNNPGGGVGGYLVDGSSGNENAFVIDGVEVSNIRNAALGRESAIPFEFVREIQVKSGGFEAEFGGATGGVINVITKSGTNNFHGEGALMFTNDGMNSRARGFWQRSPLDATVADFFRQNEDDYRTVFPGFQLGGPVVKERLHFFASYFPEVTNLTRVVNHTTGGSKTYTNKLTRHYGMGRLDYAPTQQVQINTSYLWTPIKNRGLIPNADPRVAPPTNDLSIGGGFTPSSAYSAAIAYTPMAKLSLSARYGYKFLNDKGNTYGLPTAQYLIWQRPTSAQTNPPVPAEWAGTAGKTNVSSTFQVLRDVTTRHNVYLDGTAIFNAGSQQHIIKTGYALNRMANDVEDDYINGRFDIFWGEGYTRGSINNVRGAYGYYIWQDGVRHNSKVNGRNQGFYIQDTWRAHQRVTLNLGARFENEFLPPYTKEAGGKKVPNPIAFAWGDKIAPRIGGAWDVLGTGKWKISGSYGHFFDTMKYELARTSFGGDYWHSRVYRLDNPNLGLLSKSSAAALGTLIIDIDNRTLPLNAAGELDGIDPEIKPMEGREFSFTTAHEIGANSLFSVRYTHKWLIRGIEDIGVLDADENEQYVIGNPGLGGAAKGAFGQKAPSGDPYVPKAVRDYDGLEFRLDTRPRTDLSFFLSYTWSRLWGNWAGLANSDENGRSQPNVSRAFDLFYGNFDSKGRNVFGRLATDRPHTFKGYVNYELSSKAGATVFSLSQTAWSGTPLSSEVTFIVPVLYNGRGDLGRTDALIQTDLLLAHTVTLKEDLKLKFDANVINLFNQAAVTNVTTRLNRNSSIPLPSDAAFFAGFNAEALVNPNGINPATGRAYPVPNFNPIFKMPLAYQGIREIRLGAHFIF